MPVLHRSFLLLMLVSFAALAGEGSWQGTLQDGTRVSIDPATNKATRTVDGETTPLWNGVHRLNNGAVIIVRDGVVVPDETVIEAQREQARDRLGAACMQLVNKVCGTHEECREAPACDPAKQLLIMERDELNSSWSGTVPESSTLCLEALGNSDFFASCTRHSRDAGETTCERLAARACGEGAACADSQGCRAARQLVAMEQQDQFNSPGDPSSATRQCGEALRQENAFFLPCGD